MLFETNVAVQRNNRGNVSYDIEFAETAARYPYGIDKS